ncbi:unnamed protein product [Spirodela intermedia]|uniref:KOW domain-containing protein n=1 Tax=Spirodela intermedia TaxID=51605 RepID=A0A7I8IKB6_SPIIN|nr:unnamed protein product [Spirodela intermedia]CAA6658332.1 unnamed protein product [Spirodela intermedia]
MAALQSSMAALSLSSSSFLGQRLAQPISAPLNVKTSDMTGPIVMKLKRWERKDCKPNSLPVLHKMHVKVGDTVKVISGHDKGKIGEISRIFKHNSTVIVKDINLKTKHMKSREQGSQGRFSNVMLYSKEQNVASRVGHKTLDNGSRVRYLVKTGEIVDSVEKWKSTIRERNKEKEAISS